MYLTDEQIMLLEQLTYLTDDVADAAGVLLGPYDSVENLLQQFDDDALQRLEDPGNPDSTKDYTGGKKWAAIIRQIKSDPDLYSLDIVNKDDSVPAICFNDPDDPEHAVVVFRGTSGKDEWIDNAIGLGVSDTERQKAALDYIENLPYDSITVAGHSCEDGSEFGIDPYDYDTEEEYEEALQEADFAAQRDYWDSLEYEADPGTLGEEEGYGQEYGEDWDDEDDDYDDEQEEMYPGYDEEGYEGAGMINITVTFSVEDEMQKKREKFCRQEHLIAARYLTLEGNFLFAQAIKDHFPVPCTLPEETTKREIRLDEILRKIARYDEDLSIRIWDWCIDHFLPYKEYDYLASDELGENVLLELYEFPKGFTEKLVCYLKEHPDFARKLTDTSDEPLFGMSDLISAVLRSREFSVADILFIGELEKAKGKWQLVNELAERVISSSINYEEKESIEYVRDHFLPLIAEIQDGMVQEEMPEWERKIAEYMEHMER